MHMQQQVEHGFFWLIETELGTSIVPHDIIFEHGEPSFIIGSDFESYVGEGSEIIEYIKVYGWFSRLSAPGYLDYTDWLGPFKSELKARTELVEMYS